MRRILHSLATSQALTLGAAARVEEWVLRPLRRRSAARALREAELLTALTELPDVAKVARLHAAGVRPEGGYDDAAAVAAAYARLAAPPPRRGPVQTVALAVSAVMLVGGVVGWRVATRPFDPTESGVGEAIAQNLGGYVADVINGARPSPDEAMSRVFPARALEPPADAQVAALFTAQLDAAKDPTRMPAVYASARAVNDAFSKQGQPWYLDVSSYQNTPLLYAFYREREDEGQAEGYAPERIVYLWRLDRLNISKAALGYTHREADAALVLYDKVEEFLIRDVLPALAEGERVELIDDKSRDPSVGWQEDIEVRSARMVRESFAGAADHERLLELGALLARRRGIIKSWQADLKLRSKTLRAPTRLIPEADYADELLHIVPAGSRREWDAIHDDLTSKAVMATFEALRDRFADDVARHELQHRFDAQRTRSCADEGPCAALTIPDAVRSRVGPSGDAPVAFGSMPARVRQETSAYLAEMASPTSMPKMTLLGLLRTVLDRDAWGDVYCNTTLVLLDVLAADLGYVDEGMPLVRRGAVERGAVSSLAVLLFARSDDDLRQAARRQWQKLYKEPLPSPTTRLTHQAQRWRH